MYYLKKLWLDFFVIILELFVFKRIRVKWNLKGTTTKILDNRIVLKILCNQLLLLAIRFDRNL